MNSRFVPLAAFALWSILCWRWYVCGIKQQCGQTDPAVASAVQATDTSPLKAPSADTFSHTAASNGIETEGTASTTGANTTANAATSANTQRELSDDIEKVQVISGEDRVLIHFPYNSTRRIDDDAIDAYLSELAKVLIASGGKVTLVGHSDNIGDPASNKALSLDRARHLRASLVKKGVDVKQISIKGMGEKQPIATNDNPRGRYKNRRVEVKINK